MRSEILPCLRGTHGAQVSRAEADHAALRVLAARIADGDSVALQSFGALLMEHVRFEERELYPLYENIMNTP